jgi:2-polyprenyl-3-methyl-5-hydroxy-6-metoxy-1,4-benzoquinol methylase
MERSSAVGGTTANAAIREGAMSQDSSSINDFYEIAHSVPIYEYKNPTRTWLHTKRRDLIIAKVRQYATGKRVGKALDVGFGSGVYLPVLTELFKEVVGLDSKECMVRHAGPLMEQYPHLQTVAGDITNCQMPSDSFDLIVCSEVVEHIADSQKATDEMYRVLKPGGILILSTPQRWSLLELMARIAYFPGIKSIVQLMYPGEPIFDPGHINLMTAKEVARQVTKAGFSIRERFKSGAYIPLVSDLMGEPGLRFAQWLEANTPAGPLSDVLLWDLFCIAEK